jgi:hypothetical protein
MCKRLMVFLAVALSALPPAGAAPAPTDGGARRKLQDLKKRLPRIVGAWAKARWYGRAAVEVKSVHLVGPSEAKVNLFSRDIGKGAPMPPDSDRDEVFTIYLRYYDGQWTAGRFEASWEPSNHYNNKRVRLLMLDIDSANGK